MLPPTDALPAWPKKLQVPAMHWFRPAFIGAVLAVAAILIFTGLAHYAFWDDEAATALGAKAILRVGYNSALIDHGNIVAYRHGATLKGLRNRVEPLLGPYMTAASFAVFGLHTWSGRLPFAFFGLGTIALTLFWARRESWQMLGVLAIGLIGNVSLILYARNCRYYTLSIFFSLALAYIYFRRKADYRSVAAFAALSILLFASSYLNYLAFYVCLTVDYIVWRRDVSPISWRLMLCLFIPQLVINGVIASVWNPFVTQHGESLLLNSSSNKWTLFFWQWRDADQCEFFSFPLLLLAFGVGLAQRRPLLVRGCLALAVYIIAVTLASPQAIYSTDVADVRYLTPIIPLAIALETIVICVLFESREWLPFAAALVVFGTNLLNGGPFLRDGFRSTLISYIGELIDPPSDPFKPTAEWIDRHIPEGSSIWVEPDYSAYPLMIRAPRALYAWQLTWPPGPGYADLPRIHFMGQLPPDYLVAFGPSLDFMTGFLDRWKRPDVTYKQVAMIDTYWKDLYRPELMQRSFESTTNYNPRTDAVYILERTAPPLPPNRQMK